MPVKAKVLSMLPALLPVMLQVLVSSGPMRVSEAVLPARASMSANAPVAVAEESARSTVMGAP